MMEKGSPLWIIVCAISCIVLGGLIVMTSPSVFAEEPGNGSGGQREPLTDFFTSFEEDDHLPDWDNAVETDADGNKMTDNVDGTVHVIGLDGSIALPIERVRASANNPPHETDQNLIDTDPSTKWLAFNRTAWIELKLPQPEVVVKYGLTSANDAPRRDPRDWTLYGSNDGESWTEIDSRSGEAFVSRFQTKIYEFENDQAYMYYRFDITRNAGENITQLAEIQLSTGVGPSEDERSDMVTHVSTGPRTAYAAKPNVGWTGMQALMYQGTHQGSGRAYSYNRVLDVNIKVTPDTELSYYIFPEFVNDHTDYSSTYVSVDLAFSDGTYLHQLGAVDQHGIELHPTAQGQSNTLYPNQWNFKKAAIGQVAAGKTIERILIAYDRPSGPGTFRGHIDDIAIVGQPVANVYERPTDYVNTLRGTHSSGAYSRGNTFPAVAVPHGFNFWTPSTNAGSNWIYSYHQDNDDLNRPAIQAFALSHAPSPWMGDRQTFHVMPQDTTGRPTANRERRALAFSRENEIARPHYYSVTFDNGIRTEMTPTDHAAMFRFTFAGNESTLIFDNVSNDGGVTIDAKNGVVTGYTDQKSGLSTGATRMFIYATFDSPIIESGRLTGEGRNRVTAYAKFDTAKNRVVTMKIATSLISVEQAKHNLELEIAPEDTFETVMERAQTAWDEKLSIISVEDATEDQLITLYSGLYRLFLYPNSAYENVGTNENPVYKYARQLDLQPCRNISTTETCTDIVDGKIYVNNGFWDTYRTSWPAYALLTPTKAGEMIDGFVQHYRDGGWIARWSSPGYADLMVGTSANVAFADAFLKGVTNFDVRSFYQSAIKDASVVPPNDNVGRKGMSTSVFDGFTNVRTREGLSWALDGYINDYGIANLAKVLAKTHAPDDPYGPHYATDYKYYINRAQNYVHMFNPEVEFFTGRLASGRFATSPSQFDPKAWWGDYTETNAWNMAFHAPHDGQGLANLYGGREALAAKLDEFFATPETTDGTIHEMREAKDLRMGMYGHSNQPSHHIIYMYNYAGQPWKTQEKVREVLDRLYIGSEIGQGYPGDEDNGEMSAWYIFSALGLYPLKVGSPEYAIGAPLFKRAVIHLESGKEIVIEAPNNSRENKYVQSVTLNGEAYEKNYILHEDLINGAVLRFEMGPEPSIWGSDVEAIKSSIMPKERDGMGAPSPLVDLTNGLIQQRRGVATVSGGSTAATLFDNNSESQWVSGRHPVMPEGRFAEADRPSVTYEFVDGPVEAVMYTITSAKSGAVAGTKEGEADPTGWIVQGSTDGVNWTTLDERTDESFPWRLQTRPFMIENPGEYSFYRLEVTSGGGVGQVAIAEIEWLGWPRDADR